MPGDYGKPAMSYDGTNMILMKKPCRQYLQHDGEGTGSQERPQNLTLPHKVKNTSSIIAFNHMLDTEEINRLLDIDYVIYQATSRYTQTKWSKLITKPYTTKKHKQLLINQIKPFITSPSNRPPITARRQKTIRPQY